MKRTALLTLTVVLLACSSPNEPQPAPEPAPTPEPAPAAKWAEATKKQKFHIMKTQVKPQMAAVFKGFDAEVFSAVGCKTCHGKNPKAVGFKMPSPDLPKLDPTGGFKKHKASDPEITEFMMKTVTPKMVELLGVEAWSPKTPQGFGCFSCHTKAGG